MKTTTCLTALLGVCGSLFVTSVASAHISIAGPAYAKGTWEASFSVGHGCEVNSTTTADTYAVTVDFPASITTLRAVDGNLGKATVTKDAKGFHVTWTKTALTDALPADDHFYRLPFRATLPDAPFTTLFFPAHQVCRTPTGDVYTTEWVGLGETTALPDGAAPPEPAPSVVLLPARVPGWNKFTVPVKVSALTIFNDADIVWLGNAAYSVNPSYKELIGKEPDTTALTEIPANSTIWVKY